MPDTVDTTPPSDETADIIGLLPLIAAFFRHARTDMSPEQRESFLAHGLTSRHGAVTVQLLARDGLSVGELAARLDLALSTVSGLVADLERADWVTRSRDPHNRRRTLVTLRPQWRVHVADFVATRSAPLLRAMRALTPDQRDGFAAGLRAWAHEIRPPA